VAAYESVSKAPKMTVMAMTVSSRLKPRSSERTRQRMPLAPERRCLNGFVVVIDGLLVGMSAI
jgi:hypothetical protein